MDSPFYYCIRRFARALFYLLFPMKVECADKIPASGAVMICCNHISMLDPIQLACGIRRPVRYMAKAELFRVKALNTFLLALGAFPVKRGESDMAALRTSLSILKNDELLGIFPEGTRKKEGDASQMEAGVGMIALRSGAVVIPARVFGPYRLFRRTRLVIGNPVELSSAKEKKGAAAIDEAVQCIQDAIWAIE